jgi:hypothetical protein
MNSYRVTVWAEGELRQWNLDEWHALVFWAVLSAEPETWEDWSVALRRYLPQHQLLSQGRAMPDLAAATALEPWCLLDLRGKTVILGDRFPHFENGSYSREDDEDDEGAGSPGSASTQEPSGLPDAPLAWVEVPSHWHVQDATAGWEQVVQHRAAAASGSERIDTRAILQGDPLFRYLAARVMGAERIPAWNSEEEYRATKRIHADWLMTPRDDLGGRIPREILHESRERMQWELERRGQQWSRQGFAPQGLSRESAAYRYAPWGTAEVVLYFEMIRAVLEQAWNLRRRAVPGLPAPADAVSADLPIPANVEELAGALATCAARWWDAPYEGDPDELAPRVMVDQERRKMPISSEFPEMGAPGPEFASRGRCGPCLIWFDGHHLELEDDFAFSLITDQDEWEEIQGSYAENA